jgi:hypothetical protein
MKGIARVRVLIASAALSLVLAGLAVRTLVRSHRASAERQAAASLRDLAQANSLHDSGPPYGSGGNDSWNCGVIDRHGCRIRCCDQGWLSVLPGPFCPPAPRKDDRSPFADDFFGHLTPLPQPLLDILSRRERATRFGLVRCGQRKAVRELVLANPPAALYPAWSPQPYPITVESADAKFTLVSLNHRTSPTCPFDESVATFRYGDGANPREEWWPERFLVSDATGNTLETVNRDYTDNRHAAFDSLCRRERAWKLRVRFARGRPRATPAEFLWTVSNLPAPRRDTLIEPDQVVTRNGITLRLLRISGGGTVTWSSGGRGCSEKPYLDIQAASRRSGYQLTLVRMTDERGRDLLPRTLHRFSWRDLTFLATCSHVCDAGDEEQEFELEYPPSTRRLNLTFAVHPTRTVQFLARP